MSYLHKKALQNFTIASVMVTIGYCLQWSGMALTMARTMTAMKADIVNYVWTYLMAVYVQFIYEDSIRWWNILSGIFILWAIFGATITFICYRLFSVRLAGLVAIIFMVSTIGFDVPMKLSVNFAAKQTGTNILGEAKTSGSDVSKNKGPQLVNTEGSATHSSSPGNATDTLLEAEENSLLSTWKVYNTMNIRLLTVVAFISFAILFLVFRKDCKSKRRNLNVP